MDYLGELDVITRGLIRGREEGQSQREIGRYYAAGFQDGGWGSKPRNAGGLQRKGKKTDFPRASRRNSALLTP